jgi:8-oxo-dGTP pyrophosphatase MutT (NUDIX family)
MRRAVYRGRVVDLGIEEATLPNGASVELEIIRHRGAAAVAAVDEVGRVVLIRQFRWAAGEALWELPAGVLERSDEPAEACARRELEEETGLVAREIVALGRVLPTPGYSTECIHLFLARGLGPGTLARGPDEVISEVRRVPLAEAMEMIETGDIVDGKTIAGLFLAARRIGVAG